MNRITYLLLLFLTGAFLCFCIIVTVPEDTPHVFYWAYISLLSFAGWASIFNDKRFDAVVSEEVENE